MRRATYEVERDLADQHWWFRGRRWILGAVLDRALGRVALPPEPRILDAGCGTGANTALLARYGRVTGVDASLIPLRLCPKRCCVAARLERLPFADERFDLAAALDLFEHLDDDLAGAREIYRVLQPGGLLLVTVPAHRWLWGLQDEVAEHRRRYTPGQLRRLLQAAGFSLCRLTGFNLLLLPPILAGRLALRLLRPSIASENQLTTPRLNKILGAVLGAEAPLVSRVDLPLGVSLLAVARRPAAATEGGASRR